MARGHWQILKHCADGSARHFSLNDLPSLGRPAQQHIGQSIRCAAHYAPAQRAQGVDRDGGVFANVEYGIRGWCNDDQCAALRLDQRCPGIEEHELAWMKGIASELADLPAPHGRERLWRATRPIGEARRSPCGR